MSKVRVIGVWGFRVQGFRVLGFRVLGRRGSGFGLGMVQGLHVLFRPIPCCDCHPNVARKGFRVMFFTLVGS